jgi:hypothetical protein
MVQDGKVLGGVFHSPVGARGFGEPLGIGQSQDNSQLTQYCRFSNLPWSFSTVVCES